MSDIWDLRQEAADYWDEMPIRSYAHMCRWFNKRGWIVDERWIRDHIVPLRAGARR